MITKSYVIMQNGRALWDYGTSVIDLDPLNEDPATGDVARVERLYELLSTLYAQGEPVQGWVQDARDWLDENIVANAPEAFDDETGEDG